MCVPLEEEADPSELRCTYFRVSEALDEEGARDVVEGSRRIEQDEHRCVSFAMIMQISSVARKRAMSVLWLALNLTESG